MIYVVLILLAIFVFSAVMFKRAEKREKMLAAGDGGGRLVGIGEGSRKGEPKTVRNLAVNDIVSYMGQDFMVEGKLTFEEEGDVWYEYRLVDGQDVRWLVVEEEDELELSLYKEVHDLHITSDPGEFIEYQGVRFVLDEQGLAIMRREGRTGSREGRECRYWDYTTEDESMLLSVEKWGMSYEVSIGHPIEEIALDILPGELITD